MENSPSYRVYSPGGNTTALVSGLELCAERRLTVQDYIMRERPGVEQVGFVGTDAANPELIMAGGEFCGNAARAAAWQYLDGKPGVISLLVSGADFAINAGVAENLEAWAETPVRGQSAEPAGDGVYKVAMEGISHLVLLPEASRKYLREKPAPRHLDDARPDEIYKERLLVRAFELLENAWPSYNAAGVIFTETVVNDAAVKFAGSELLTGNADGVIKIHPCVFVKNAGTAFYETACGSGSAAVAVTLSCLRGVGLTISVLQPSGSVINASVVYSGGRALCVKISGPVFEI